MIARSAVVGNLNEMARRQVWHMFGQHAFFQDTRGLQKTFSQLSDMMGRLSELVEAYEPGTERETGLVFRNSMDAFRSEFDIFSCEIHAFKNLIVFWQLLRHNWCLFQKYYDCDSWTHRITLYRTREKIHDSHDATHNILGSSRTSSWPLIFWSCCFSMLTLVFSNNDQKIEQIFLRQNHELKNSQVRS